MSDVRGSLELRKSKGWDLYLAGKVRRIVGDKYKVSGRYDVRLLGAESSAGDEVGTCDCPDYEHQAPKAPLFRCKHIWAAIFFTGAEQARNDEGLAHMHEREPWRPPYPPDQILKNLKGMGA